MNFNGVGQFAEEQIAIVGMGCRLPGGVHDHHQFWDFLKRKGEGIVEVPSDRWSTDAFYSSESSSIGRARSKHAGFIDNIWDFDPDFFDIAPREAEGMDPQQRILLQVVYEALQDANLPLSVVSQYLTGIFVGISTSDYRTLQEGDIYRAVDEIFAGTGTALCIAANRISHRFNLTGPSFSVDTACSSSMVALDAACENLLLGRCDVSVAAGVNALIGPMNSIVFSKANMLSPTGELSTFDRRANGFVRGEGVGAVVLKRLSKALEDGDRVYATIRATCVNQDGRTRTLTAPSQSSQMSMLENLCTRAGVNPEHVGYVEAHGTGTPTGDPIEAAAIGRTFAKDRLSDLLWIGSVKPNVGHLESGAGITGLIKGAMSAYTGEIAPNIRFEEPNPNIPFDALNMWVPVDVEQLPEYENSRYVVVNSFGFGGTNASALLQSFDMGDREHVPLSTGIATSVAKEIGPTLVPISAASPTARALTAQRLASALDNGGSLADTPVQSIAAGLAHGRDHLTERCVLLAKDKADLRSKLMLVAQDAVEDLEKTAVQEIITGRSIPNPVLAFTFAGQGSQWWAMGRHLLEEDLVYREGVDAFDALFEPLAGWKTRDAMLASAETSRVDDSTITQPTICSLQVALARMWEARGVVPDFILGHSLGEAAAAHISGAIDFETMVRFIYTRSMIRDHLDAVGAMAAIALSAVDITPLLPTNGSIQITGYNSPAMVSIGGDRDAVYRFVEDFQASHPGVLCRLLATDTAWHSHHLKSGEKWFRDTVGTIPWETPKIPIISTVTGRLESRFDIDYLWSNLAEPVMYRDAVDMAIDCGANIFLEVSPHRTLSGLTSAMASERNATAHIINSLHREQDAGASVAQATAELYVRGVDVDWNALAPRQQTLPDLPKYPWEAKALENLGELAHNYLFDGDQHPLLGRRQNTPKPSWMRGINSTGVPFLADHQLEGEAVFPATGYLEMAFAAGLAHFGQGPIEIEDVVIGDALFVAPDVELRLLTEIDPERNILRLYSRVAEEGEQWQQRAQCVIRQRSIEFSSVDPVTKLPSEGIESVTTEEWYRNSDSIGFIQYGPAFRVVQNVHFLHAEQSSIAFVQAHPSTHQSFENYFAHPALLDAALQMTDPNLATMGTDEAVFTEEGFVGSTKYIPRGVRRVVWLAPVDKEIFAICRWKMNGEEIVGASTTIYNEAGQPLLFIDDVFWNAVPAEKNKASGDAFNGQLLEETAVPVSLPVVQTKELAPRKVVLLADASEASMALAGALRDLDFELEVIEKGAVSSTSIEDCAQDFAKIIGPDNGVDHVIFAWPLDHTQREGDVSTDDLLADVESDVLTLIALGKAYAEDPRPSDEKPKLTMLTCNAQSIDREVGFDYAALTQAPVLPLLRAIAIECEMTDYFGLIDANPDLLKSPDKMLDGLFSDHSERTLMYRNGEWYGMRLGNTDFDTLPARCLEIHDKDTSTNFMVTMEQPGIVDTLAIQQLGSHTIDPEEVVIRVKSVGLNFRDVMAVTGLLPREAEQVEAHKTLGLEFAGVIDAVGDAVTGLQPGDRVMGMNKRCLQRFLKVAGSSVVKLPDSLTFDEASTLPSVFVTAHYALNHVARLRPTDRILIHVATGGVGLAAIQLAQKVGAEIYATAGSEEKRQYLRDLGIKHVMNSRNLDFSEEIMERTNGAGVDVVLNSLPNHFIKKALDILAPYGRFVEIGKRDVYADTPIGMKALRRNVQLAVLDLAALGEERPDYMREMMDEIRDMLGAGEIKALPFTSYPISEIVEAFRYMTQAKHIGKVVVDMNEPRISVTVDKDAQIEFDRDASYLITGGSRGFGLSVADWMSQNGAGRLVLGSRSGRVDAEDVHRIAEIEARGTVVESIKLDVINAGSVDSAVADLVNAKMPLKGIVHGAALIDDGLLTQLDDDHVERVLRPKIAGAWNIHRALENRSADLDFLVSFSSTAELFGARGQANYVAANGFLNGFSRYRRAQGKEALTVAWGPLGGSGFVARNAALATYLESVGLQPVPENAATEALGQMMRIDVPSLGFGGFDWARFARSNPEATRDARTASLLEGAGMGSKTRILTKLRSIPSPEWPALMREFVAGEIVKVLKTEVEDIPDDRLLTELGLDSLSSFELKNRIESELNVGLPVSRFVQAPTLGDLSTLLADVLEATLEAEEENAQVGEADVKGEESGAAEFRASDRQIGLVATSMAPMSSANVRDALETSAVDVIRLSGIEHSASEVVERVEQAIGAVALSYPLLRLTLTSGSDVSATPRLTLGPVPNLELVAASITEAPALDFASGALARLQIAVDVDSEADVSRVTLALTAHNAVLEQGLAIDVLHQIRAQLCSDGTLEQERVELETTVLDSLAIRSYDEADASAQGHRAYWFEALTPFVSEMEIPKRSRAFVDTGLGRNAGFAAAVGCELESVSLSEMSADKREARLLVALSKAMSEVFGAQDLIVDRIVPDLGALEVGYAAGPLVAELPLVLRNVEDTSPDALIFRAERQITNAWNHQAFDANAIEMNFEGELRRARTNLSQIAIVDRDRFDGHAVEYQFAPRGVALHEILLAVSSGGSKEILALNLVFDTDAVDARVASELAEKIVSFLTVMSEEGAAASVLIDPVQAVPLPDLKTPRGARRERAISDSVASRWMAPSDAQEQASTEPKASVHSLSAWQKYTMAALDEPCVTQQFEQFWTLQYATTYNINFDVERLDKVFRAFASKQEALRMRMERCQGQWRVVVDPDHKTGVRLFDLSALTEEQLDAELAKRAAEPIDLNEGPLLTFDILRCGRNRDILHFRAHHLVVDAWSQLLFFDEIVNGYIGVPSPQTMPISFERFLEVEEAAIQNPERDEYWSSVIEPVLPAANIGRIAKGLPRNGNGVITGETSRIVVTLDPVWLESASKFVKKNSISMNALVSAAFARTLCDLSDAKGVYLNSFAAGRTQSELRGLVAPVADYRPVRCVPTNEGDLISLAKSIYAQQAAGEANSPARATFMDPEIDRMVEEAGGYLRQFHCGMLLPETKADQQSGLAASIRAKPGETVQAGPLKYRNLPLPEAAHTFRELDLRFVVKSDGLELRLSFETEAYTEDEAKQILRATVYHLAQSDVEAAEALLGSF